MLLYVMVARQYVECRCGGQVVSVLAFSSTDPSLNPAEVKLLLKRTKRDQGWPSFEK